MRRLAWITACGLVLGIPGLSAGPGVAEQEEARQEEQQEEEREAEKKTGDTAAEPRRARAAGWWNDPGIVETLTLSEAQRQKMDSQLEAYRAGLDAQQPTPRSTFTDALKAGDWKRARAALKELSQQAARPIHAHGELKIEVLSGLNDEQLEKLAENYPRLIGQPWMRSTRRGGPRRRPAAP